MSFAPAARVLLVGVGVSMAPLASAAAAGTANLVDEGRRLFFTETFAGNGRTCGSCHPADNNYTIDAAYIARLPKSDPLLAADFLDDPVLLRKLGLVTVHADGFGRPGVQRGVPTLLGLARSLVPDFGAVGRPHRRGRLVGRRRAGRRLAARLRDRRGPRASRQDPGPRRGGGFPPADRARAARAREVHAVAWPRRRGRTRARRLHRRDLPLAAGRGRPPPVQRRGIGAVRPLPQQRHRAERGPTQRHVRDRSPAPPQHAGAPARSRPAGRRRLRPLRAGGTGPARRLRRRPVQHAVPDRGGGHHTLVPRQFGGDDRGRGPVLHHPDLRQLDRGPDAQHPPDEFRHHRDRGAPAHAQRDREHPQLQRVRDPGAGPATRRRPAAAAAGGRRHERRDHRAHERPATALCRRGRADRRRAVAGARGGADPAGGAPRLSPAAGDRAQGAGTWPDVRADSRATLTGQ